VKRKKLQAPHSRKLTDPDHYPQVDSPFLLDRIPEKKTKYIPIPADQRKFVNYKHPGNNENSKKPVYEDVDKFFECPHCGSTIDNYTWRCYMCRYEASVYNEPIDGVIDYRHWTNIEETKELRKNLIRVNPWTGEKWNGK